MLNEFTRENQAENSISTTTKQKVAHRFLEDVVVTISGRWNTEEHCSVWVDSGKPGSRKSSRKYNDISLEQAIEYANIMIVSRKVLGMVSQ